MNSLSAFKAETVPANTSLRSYVYSPTPMIRNASQFSTIGTDPSLGANSAVVSSTNPEKGYYADDSFPWFKYVPMLFHLLVLVYQTHSKIINLLRCFYFLSSLFSPHANLLDIVGIHLGIRYNIRQLRSIMTWH
jgi:hypothetical protein